MTTLPAYSGTSVQCPKCAASGVGTAYHPVRCRLGDGEHLCRHCRNCDHWQAEACAGSGGAKPLRPVPGEEGTED